MNRALDKPRSVRRSRVKNVLWAMLFIVVGMSFILGVFVTIWRLVTLFAIAAGGVLYLSPGVTFGLAALITLLVLGKLVR